MSNILLIVDPQNDFIYGSLAVEGADIAMVTLNHYIKENKFKSLDTVIVTCDFHPYNHCSFKEVGGLWPTHCVKHSEGAAIPEFLNKTLSNSKINIVHFEKGSDKNEENYSFIQAIINYGDLDALEFRLSNTCNKIYITGIAGDYCVLETIKDLDFVHSKLIVVKNCIASIDGGEALTKYCLEKHIELINEL